MLLKCADIGHLAADQETHKKWAYQLEEEFFQQVIHCSCSPAPLHFPVSIMTQMTIVGSQAPLMTNLGPHT